MKLKLQKLAVCNKVVGFQVDLHMLEVAIDAYSLLTYQLHIDRVQS